MSETKTTAAKSIAATTSIKNMNETAAAAAAATEAASAVSTTLLSSSRKLLLKNQLHLNLNVSNDENVKSVDKGDRGHSREIARKLEAVATSEVVKFKDDVKKFVTTTVTTVPQQQQSKIEATTTASSLSSSLAAATASSLLNSSPSALAKFNRIIDSTMSSANCYQQRQKQDIGTTSDSTYKINFTSKYGDDDVSLYVQADNVDGDVAKIVKEKDDEILGSGETDEDNQIKRNDVHYLLKQLNSFSDIEEIEIVDIKQRRQQNKEQKRFGSRQDQRHVAARDLTTTTATTTTIAAASVVTTQSPTATSLVIISPSSQSHKESRHAMRRFASLHPQHEKDENEKHSQRQQRCYTLNGSGGNLVELCDRLDSAQEQQYLLQQFDDYLFESCHYLETNYFATTYRTAMIESSSHEFRPSTTTNSRSLPSAASSPHSFEIHEVELPSVICRAPPPPSPTRRFHTQALLTSSGVQTELTASSLSTTTNGAEQSMAKSSSCSSGTSACSYTSSTEQRRRVPFFKCCYTPIDRWREKRSAAAAASGGGNTHSSTQPKTTTSSGGVAPFNAGGTSGTSRSGSQKPHGHVRKSGSAV